VLKLTMNLVVAHSSRHSCPAWLSRLGGSLIAVVTATVPAAGAPNASRPGLSEPPAPLSALPAAEQQSFGQALDAARHSIEALTPAETALPVNEGVRIFAFNPGQRLTARFFDGGVRIGSGRGGEWTATLRFAVSGKSPDGDSAPVIRGPGANRVDYFHSRGVTEWYVNRAAGIEHGFTVDTRPKAAEDSGDLRLEVVLDGLMARVAESSNGSGGALEFNDPVTGRGVLRYDGLNVWDAQGRSVAARLEVLATGFAIVVADGGAEYPLTVDPLITSIEAKLGPQLDGDGRSVQHFGQTVALSGDTALIGAPGDYTGTQVTGAAYVFVRNGTAWTRQSKLKSGEAEPGPWFGSTVALSGDTALVTRGDAAYVFVRESGQWTRQAKLENPGLGLVDGQYAHRLDSIAISGDTATLCFPAATTPAGDRAGTVTVFSRRGEEWAIDTNLTPDDAAPDRLFGTSVALAGDDAIVGASRSTATYVFVRNGGSWSQQAKLTPTDPAAAPDFGVSVAIDGDTALIGAYSESPAGPGSAYVFARSGSEWNQQARLTAPVPVEYDSFGRAVSLSGTTALVGTLSENAYVYVRSGASWIPQVILRTPPSVRTPSVAIDGGTALVGASEANTEAAEQAGAAFVFERAGAAWSEQAILTAGDPAAGVEFGFSLALEGTTALVGAPGDATPVGPRSGSAYVLVREAGSWAFQAGLRSQHTPQLLAYQGREEFGTAVALSGDTALIGAPKETTGYAPWTSGAATVFVRSGTTWSHEAKLLPEDRHEGDDFGTAVALSGDTALVGAPRKFAYATPSMQFPYHTGNAYTFVRSGGAWDQQGRLDPPGATPDPWLWAVNEFGRAVALSGDTALVGGGFGYSLSTNEGEGAASVFVRTGNLWMSQAELVPRDGPTDTFGWSLALQGNLALVGTPGADDRPGAVHVFERLGATWQEQAGPQVSNPEPGDGFGRTVAMSGNLALVGTGLGPNYLFRRDGGPWDPMGELLRPAADLEDSNSSFGESMAISGDTILVGDWRDSTFDVFTGTTRYGHGSVYVYRVLAQGASVLTIDHTGSEVIFQCTGEAGATYLLERSSTLSDWAPIGAVTSPAGGAFTVSDEDPPLPGAFYRLHRE
jgi:hypothetical protein